MVHGITTAPEVLSKQLKCTETLAALGAQIARTAVQCLEPWTTVRQIGLEPVWLLQKLE